MGTATFPLGPALCREISDGHRPFNEAPSGPCPLACNSQCPAGEARQPHHRPRATPASSLRALPALPLSNPLCPVGAAPPPPTHAPPPAQLPQLASLRPADCSLRCATCSPPAAASLRASPVQLRSTGGRAISITAPSAPQIGSAIKRCGPNCSHPRELLTSAQVAARPWLRRGRLALCTGRGDGNTISPRTWPVPPPPPGSAFT